MEAWSSKNHKPECSQDPSTNNERPRKKEWKKLHELERTMQRRNRNGPSGLGKERALKNKRHTERQTETERERDKEKKKNSQKNG